MIRATIIHARLGLALLVFGVVLAVPAVHAAEPAVEGLGETGTDPRDFAPKFMPYYRYTELENGLEENMLTMFGLHAFNEDFAMTYEIPLGMKRDVRGTDLHNGDGTCGPGSIRGGEGRPPFPVPAGGDCDQAGVGDMNLRFFYRTDWDALGGDWLIGTQIDFPTASEDELGTESLVIGPKLTVVKDIEAYPAPGAFMALMNFYFFDVYKDGSRDDTSMYVGRWFFMLPLSAPGDGIFDGLYALPEFQPIYDFEEDHFSFWAGPEIGKMLAPGRLLYLKPGFGVDGDKDEGDREWTLEVGWRYFMD